MAEQLRPPCRPYRRISYRAGEGLRDAARELERNEGLERLEYVTIFPLSPSQFLGHAHRFVDALEDREVIRQIRLSGLRVDGEEEEEEEEEEEDDGAARIVIRQEAVNNLLEHLFGIILPNHNFLNKQIEIVDCGSQCVELLVSAFPVTRSLESLLLSWTFLEPTYVQAIANMIRRNVQIGFLSIHHYTFVSAVSVKSPLKLLRIGATWTTQAFIFLAECLRRNMVLVSLHLMLDPSSPKSNLFVLLHNLLAMHNFTLREVRFPTSLHPTRHQERIDELLKRNERIRRANNKLEARQYRVKIRSIWPLVMERISPMPELLYRFFRRGNVGAFADHLQTLHRRKRNVNSSLQSGKIGKLKGAYGS